MVSPHVREQFSQADRNEAYLGGNELSHALLTQVMTPRPDLAVKLTNGEVGSIADSQAYQLAAAEYDASGKSFGDRLFAARQIANVVHQAVHHKSMDGRKTPLSAETINEKHEANCVEAALMISYALTNAKVPHYIAQVNTHTLILIEGKKHNRYGLINTDSRALSGDITGAITGKGIQEQLSTGQQFATMTLDTKALRQIQTLDTSSTDGVDTFGWLSYRKKDDNRVAEDDQLLIARIYTPEVGQRVITNYFNANAHANANNLEALEADWEELDGLYPDVDPRSKDTVLRESMVAFQKAGQFGNALFAAKAFDNSLTETNSARFVYPDRVRTIGNIACSPELLLTAIDLYSEFPADMGEDAKTSTAQKIKTTQEQLDRIKS